MGGPLLSKPPVSMHYSSLFLCLLGLIASGKSATFEAKRPLIPVLIGDDDTTPIGPRPPLPSGFLGPRPPVLFDDDGTTPIGPRPPLPPVFLGPRPPVLRGPRPPVLFDDDGTTPIGPRPPVVIQNGEITPLVLDPVPIDEDIT